MNDFQRKKRVMLNPSCQYSNQVFDDAGVEIYNEGRVMWRFAQAVKKHLELDPRIEAFISRQSETALSNLDTEAQLTNELGCDALVALHSDATADGSPGGGTWTFYTGNTHFTENELVTLPYPLSESRRLADGVQCAALQAVRMFYNSQDRGVREHWNRLKMLHSPRCPCCLVEILFHSNPVERELLKRADFQDAVGKAISQVILEFFFGEVSPE